MDIELIEIPPPAEGTATVFTNPDAADGWVFMRGDGPSNFLCPNCRRVLAAGVESPSISGIVFRCPACQAHSRTRR